MPVDPHANFPYSFVETAPSPALSGTTLKLRGGGAYYMPRGGAFNAVDWKAGVIATPDVAEIVRCSTIAETTIAVASNGAVLPQATINVASSAGFASGGGTCTVVTSAGPQVVTYTGKAAGTLTGCTGGEGVMATGGAVVDDWLTIARAQESTTARSIKIGDQFMAAITKKVLTDLESGLGGSTEYDYQEETSPLTVASTSEGTADTWIDGVAVTYDGSTRIKIEAWADTVTASGGTAVAVLFDGAVAKGWLCELNGYIGGFYAVRYLTPSAAAHTYHIKWWKTGGTVIVGGDVGGAGKDMPAFMRITKA